MEYPRLLILGGAGKTGRKLIQQALERGYEVTAMVRNPDALADLEHARLTVERGDMNDAASLEKLLGLGFDAVLSTLGIFQKEPGTPLADMTRVLVHAMEDQGPKRIVVMSSLGVGDSKGQGNIVVKFVTGWILRYVLVDKGMQEQVLKQSSLDWTVLRPPRLLESDSSQHYRLWQGRERPRGTRWEISNFDAAREMLELLEKPESLHQAYQCSY